MNLDSKGGYKLALFLGVVCVLAVGVVAYGWVEIIRHAL